MKFLQGILTVFAVLVIGVSLLNDGGTLLALFVAAVVVLVAVAVPFAKEYFLAASKGKWAGEKHHDRQQQEVRDE